LACKSIANLQLGEYEEAAKVLAHKQLQQEMHFERVSAPAAAPAPAACLACCTMSLHRIRTPAMKSSVFSALMLVSAAAFLQSNGRHQRSRAHTAWHQLLPIACCVCALAGVLLLQAWEV
jgi:hypothetical protein